MDGPGFVVADGKDGLADHRAQFAPGNGETVFVLYCGQLGKVLGIGGQNIELAHTAGDVDHIAIGLKGDDIVGQLPDDLAEKPGGEYQASLLINLGGHHGTDPGFQIIAGQAQVGPGFQEDAL